METTQPIKVLHAMRTGVSTEAGRGRATVPPPKLTKTIYERICQFTSKRPHVPVTVSSLAVNLGPQKGEILKHTVSLSPNSCIFEFSTLKYTNFHPPFLSIHVSICSPQKGKMPENAAHYRCISLGDIRYMPTRWALALFQQFSELLV